MSSVTRSRTARAKSGVRDGAEPEWPGGEHAVAPADGAGVDGVRDQPVGRIAPEAVLTVVDVPELVDAVVGHLAPDSSSR